MVFPDYFFRLLRKRQDVSTEIKNTAGKKYTNPTSADATSPAMIVASSGLEARADCMQAETVSIPISGYSEAFTVFLRSWLSEMTLAT